MVEPTSAGSVTTVSSRHVATGRSHGTSDQSRVLGRTAQPSMAQVRARLYISFGFLAFQKQMSPIWTPTSWMTRKAWPRRAMNPRPSNGGMTNR